MVALPLFVALYAFSTRWDSSLLPQGATLQWMAQLLDQPRIVASVARTLALASVASMLTVVLGTAATVAGRMYSPRLTAVLDLLAQLPFAVPPVVIAITAIQLLVGRLGGALDIRVAYVALLMPLLFPFVHRTVSGTLEQLDIDTLAQASRSLGATEALTLRRVVTPLLGPAIVASALLCLMAASLEFTIANLLLGGDFELLQPLINSLRANNGHQAAALVILSFSIIVLAAVLVRLLTRRSGPTRTL
ncbi:MAG: ABC transporter permease subunit [Betaproteobacteria bacterium]|nr:ABC transporter permease subunit [Betaproteobacteria bacterium]